MLHLEKGRQNCTAIGIGCLPGQGGRGTPKMVRLVGLEPTTGKSPADFKPAAYANFATAAPGIYAANSEYHAGNNPLQRMRRSTALADRRQKVRGGLRQDLCLL